MHAEYAEVFAPVGSSVCSGEYEGDYQQHTMACLAKDNGLYVIQNIPEKIDCRVNQQPAAAETAPVVVTPTPDDTTPGTATAASLEGGNRRQLLISKEEVACDELTNKRVYLFNTLAIYDPSGVMVAKYRKSQTATDRFDFAHPGSNKEVVDLQTFETDFGVEFAVLICADAFNPHIFNQYMKDDGNIKNVIIPFYDAGRPPVYTITSVHNGYSTNFGVNVVTSASNTVGGVGVYEAGRPLYWDINAKFFEGNYARSMKVVEVPKVPAPHVVSTEPVTSYEIDPNQVVESCRFFGSNNAEMQCPCSKVVVAPGEVTSFAYSLEMPVSIYGRKETLSCSVRASLTANNGNVTETQNYAMMVGWLETDDYDEQAFCELVNCPNFPDCSKDCPNCFDVYKGQATLTEFSMMADVPDYFEVGNRQMRLPQMNGKNGAPESSDKYDWILGDDGNRYMNLKEGEEVPSLFSAGAFYIGFAPFDGYTDAEGNILAGPGTGGTGPEMPIVANGSEGKEASGGSVIGTNAWTTVLAVLMLIGMVRR